MSLDNTKSMRIYIGGLILICTCASDRKLFAVVGNVLKFRSFYIHILRLHVKYTKDCTSKISRYMEITGNTVLCMV